METRIRPVLPVEGAGGTEAIRTGSIRERQAGLAGGFSFGPAYLRSGAPGESGAGGLYGPDAKPRGTGSAAYSEEAAAEARTLGSLEQRDRQVRQKAEGEGEALGGEQFIYQRGPDGELYAIGSRPHLVRAENEEGQNLPGRELTRTEGDLSREDRLLLEKLRQRDAKVRGHEINHVLSAGGQAGQPAYTYQTGPDGQRYAIGGSVSISMISTGDPDADARSARRAQRAALANGEASGADLQAAAKAREQEAASLKKAAEYYRLQEEAVLRL